ncbi:MAG: hypothetical protein V1779_13940 [bacterium]
MKYNRLLFFSILIQILLTTGLFAQRWEKVVSIPQPYLSNYWLDVYFLPSNPNFGWVCGFGGRVIRTTDGGNTWAGASINGADHLEGIHFPSVNIGYTSGLDGIFKSTDGGANWFNVTPPSATASMWGTYFLDNNNGFVIGGGCVEKQEFWRTTDGGNSWSVFVGNLANSGLTDLIVYSMFGQGYASSSGWIWETTDGGVTWSLLSNTGPNDWQEEITKVGNSFLVPTSTGCQGGGGGGGMRYTTDNGASWNVRNTGVRMFGSFLLSAQTGWVAGDSRNVWYTTNGGQSWVLRNCGFDDGNLDDIWFITSNNGWIVGQGVYKLSTPLQTANKNSLNFSEICIPGDSIDFVLLDNINFNSDFVNVSILNDPNNEFSIVSPGTNFNINSCETIRLNIKFAPKTVGTKTAIVRIDFGYGTSLNVNLAGYGVAKTIAPRDTLLIINPAYCGNDNVYGIQWTAATDRESIVDIARIDGNQRIENQTYFPLRVPNGGIQSQFSANPIDTGWISTRFRCTFDPCPADTFVTVMAYGVSPIITAQYSSTMTLKCSDIGYDTIPVYNTGNTDLIISDTKILEPNTNYSVTGWANGNKLPVIIAPGISKSIIVNFKKQAGKSNNATLQLINNDQTYANGEKNPFHIGLAGSVISSNLITSDTTIDFGKVCLTDIKIDNFWIYNFGDFEVTFDQPKVDSLQYQASLSTTTYPKVLPSGDSARCTVTFQPDRIGRISDTIYISSQPCNDIIKVAVTGIGISVVLDTDPQKFSASFQTNTPFTARFNVQSIGTEDLILYDIELDTILSNIQISVDPPLSQTISYNGNKDFDVTFTCSSDTIYQGLLHFKATGSCQSGKGIPLFLQSYSTKIEFDRDSVNFGKFFCTPGYYLDTIWIRNPESFTDTINKFQLDPAGSPFTILNNLPLPYTINSNDSIPIYIEYAAFTEGQHSATISMGTSTAKNITKYLYLTGEFRRSDTRLSAKEAQFGDIEQCDRQKEITVKLHNSGSLQDSMTINALNGFQSFILVPDDYIIIPSLDSAEITVYMNPSDFATGIHNAKIQLQSKICPCVDTLDCTVNIFHHLISYTPDTIKFGEVWAEDISTKYFKIENKSQYEKNIISMELPPDDINFSLPSNLVYPMKFKTGDTLSIPVSFSSPIEGDFISFVKIFEESICIDSAFIYLTAKVPEEKYEATIQIGNYTAKPGQKITMTANLSNSIHNLKHQGINYRFSFDPYLFFPTATFIQITGDNKITYPYTYHNGVISGTIDSSSAEYMLRNAGDVLWIQGSVFLSSPIETPITIEQFEPVTGKQVDLTKIDGSLKLLEVCLPLADFKLKFINQPKVMVTKNPVTDGSLNLNIKYPELDLGENLNSKENNLNLKIFSIGGGQIYGLDFTPNSTSCDLSIDVSMYTSGVYYIVLSNYGFVWTERFIILN